MLRKEVRAGLSTDSGSNCDMNYETAIGALCRRVGDSTCGGAGQRLG